MKNQWIVIDTQTGAMDGFYKYEADAVAFFRRRQQLGCNSLAVCQIKHSSKNLELGDDVFWGTSGKGFAKQQPETVS